MYDCVQTSSSTGIRSLEFMLACTDMNACALTFPLPSLVCYLDAIAFIGIDFIRREGLGKETVRKGL